MKSRWLWLAIPWAIFLILAAGWSAYWLGLSAAVRDRLEAVAAREHVGGFRVSIGAIEARGFPMLLRLELSDLALAPVDEEWRISTAAGALHVQMFNPEHVIYEARAPIVIARAEAVSTLSADALIVSVRLQQGAFAQAGIEADALVLDDPAEPGELRVGKLVVNLRPDPRSDAEHQIALSAEALSLPRPVRSFEGLGQEVALLRAAIVLEQSSALLESAEGDTLGPWSAAGGRLRFEALALNWGALSTTGAGWGSLDEERRLIGELALPIDEPAQLFRALAAGPGVEAETRQALTLLSAAFAQNAAPFTLDVEAQGGVLRLEGLRARSLPPVYKPD